GQPVGLLFPAYPSTMYGQDVVSNGGFDNGMVGWSIAGGANVTAGVDQAIFSAVSTNNGLTQNSILSIGKTYRVSYTIVSISDGSIRAAIGASSNGAVRSAPGVYSEVLTNS